MKFLILGNGFDLAHGLPTSYRDFFKFAEAALAIYDFKDDSTDISAVVKNYSENYLDLWQDERSMVGEIKRQLKDLFRTREFRSTIIPSNLVVFVNERLNEFNDNLRSNVWYYYLKNLDDLKLKKNWNNIEEEISVIIEMLDRNPQSLHQDFLELSNSIVGSTEKDINKQKKFKLFEKSYKQRCNDTSRELRDVARLRKRSFNDLKDFIRAFEIYLEDFIEPNIPKIERLPFFDANRFDYIINFNYTHTYEKVYGIAVTRMCHVHGICRSSRKSNIVIGIGDYTKKGKPKFTIFKKTAQVLQNHNDMNYVFWKDEIETNEELVDVYIYGHSLDLADKYVLESFLDSEYTKVHIYAHSKESEETLNANLIRIIGEDTMIRKSTKNPSKIKFMLTTGK